MHLNKDAIILVLQVLYMIQGEIMSLINVLCDDLSKGYEYERKKEHTLFSKAV